MPLKYGNFGNFNGLNMDEYDIIAVPKRFTSIFISHIRYKCYGELSLDGSI